MTEFEPRTSENETSIQSDPMLEYKVAQTLPKVAKK